MMIDKRTVGLYVHIPFCIKKCAYCDFYSQSDYRISDRYLDALLKEAENYSCKYPDLTVDTLYIGGGTPSSLSAMQLDRLFASLKRYFTYADDIEITVEVNPATLTEEGIAVLQKHGVTRVSMGLQSASDSELSTLSRIHTFGDFVHTFQLVKGRVDQISLDLMFGLPSQTVESLKNTLEKAVSLSPDHISLYALKIEEGTPFAKMGERLSLPDEDTVADMYLTACDVLESAGFHQYEISNFAKQGCFSQHNYRYWKRGEYIGLGPGAHSFFDGKRYGILRDIYRYMDAIEKGETPPLSELGVTSRYDAFTEEIMLGLRLNEGVSLRNLFLEYGYPMEKPLLSKLERFVETGYAVWKGDRFALTPKGFLVSNGIIGEIIPNGG